MSAPTSCGTRSTLVTRVGPLTTVFTPPSDCTGNLQFELKDGTAVSPLPPYVLWDIGHLDKPTACYPSRNSAWTNGYPTSTHYFYSPGVCPRGYVTASYMPRLSCPVEALRPSETLILCCPEGFWADPQPLQGWICTSTFTTPKLLTINWGLSGTRTPSITAIVTPTTEMTIYDDAVKIIITGTSQPADAGSDGTASDSGSSSGLSNDAKIAIGVAVPIAAIAIATAIGFYIFFRRRLAKRSAAIREESAIDASGKPELDNTAVAAAGKKDEGLELRSGPPGIERPELDTTAPAGGPLIPQLANQPLEYELAATSGPLYEMPPAIKLAELEGDR